MYVNDLGELVEESVRDRPDKRVIYKDRFGKQLYLEVMLYYINKIFSKLIDQNSPFQRYGLHRS